MPNLNRLEILEEILREKGWKSEENILVFPFLIRRVLRATEKWRKKSNKFRHLLTVVCTVLAEVTLKGQNVTLIFYIT